MELLSIFVSNLDSLIRDIKWVVMRDFGIFCIPILKLSIWYICIYVVLYRAICYTRPVPICKVCAHCLI